jgi:hypothetical protein
MKSSVTAAADAHAQGWERVLGWLDAYMAAGDAATQAKF